MDGYSCLAQNSETQGACVPGQYRINDGTNPVCRDCLIGHYCPSVDKPPVMCEPGTYSVGGKLTTCLACPAGSFCPTLGGNAPVTCPLGTYQPNVNKTYCNSCPPGSYCPSLTQSAPLACPSGSYSPVTNSTYCFECPTGFFCPSTSTQLPIACPRGYYSAANSSICTKCEGGSSCLGTRVSDKVSCDPLTGYFSFEGSSHCFKCPLGYSCSLNIVATAVLKVGEPVLTKC